MLSKGFLLLLWVLFAQLAALYLFTSGFLLTRLSLADVTTCKDSSCKLPATHKRAILLIIDALRFDFVSPEPPSPPSPYHHNVLTLPRQLTASRPEHSLLFYSYADPPTTTLQRIKGLTTGSLPTFVDVGNNFGGSSIAEDSIIKQLNLAGKKVAFMGDDTWMSVFPDSFEPNMRHPYDSFNVEDLHTVDEGVMRHLFPLLNDTSRPFDFLVGHFLGVDHVGHRVGPDHPSMKAKLTQMNDVLKRVVDLLDDETLLVVLGDHGMDRSGDHGGDGDLETAAALWIYSKKQPISKDPSSIPSGLLQYKKFPDTTTSFRWVQQIDLVPSLSLLLGLPIPFNNLGTIIPEIFWRGGIGTTLQRALELNVAQVKAYLQAYRDSPSGGELDDAWGSLQTAYNLTQSKSQSGAIQLITLSNYSRVALSACRKMWAQFNPTLMVLGLILMATHILTLWSVHNSLSHSGVKVSEAWIARRLPNLVRGAAAGALVGFLLAPIFQIFVAGIDSLDCILFTAPLGSTLTLLSFKSIKFTEVRLAPIILILHAICFLSNSFTFWEGRIVTFLLFTSILPYASRGLYAPTSLLRSRILGFSFLFAICVRLMAISTVCREEMGAYCHVTFYASSSLPSPPLLVAILALPTAIALPKITRRFLNTSRSDSGLATSFLPIILTPTLLAGPSFWLIEWVDSASIVGELQSAFLRVIRTWIARIGFIVPILGGGALWWFAPVCLEIEVQEQANRPRQVKIIGFANTFGSPYLLFWTIFFALVYTTTQLTGQIVLALGVIALIAYLEVLDSVRDARVMQQSHKLEQLSTIADPAAALNFDDIVPIALLGLHMFYATGHESVISSIQWKSAFLLTPKLNFMLSAITVILNSLGPFLLVGLAIPLVAMWNRGPMSIQPSPSANDPRTKHSTSTQTSSATTTPLAPTDLQERNYPDTQIRAESILAGLGLSMYYATLLFGTAVSAAILRRHLMVWKVFAPRFMAGALELIVLDVGILVGVGLGVERIAGYVNKMFAPSDAGKR